MRNSRNANFYEGDKYYNTNQNNLNENNLDNNHDRLRNLVSTPISEVEISSEFDEKKRDYQEVLEGGKRYYNNQSSNKFKNSK